MLHGLLRQNLIPTERWLGYKIELGLSSRSSSTMCVVKRTPVPLFEELSSGAADMVLG